MSSTASPVPHAAATATDTARTFLVTGATGDTGSQTVALLLGRGHRVRALAHREDGRSKKLEAQGAEVVIGDLLDLAAIRRALVGVYGAYFCFPISPGIVEATAYFAQAAREARVEVIVNMSQISARSDAKSQAAVNHWVSEQVFDWAGVPTVHLRPTYFADWFLYHAAPIKRGLLHVPFGSKKHAPIAAEDQARVIVGLLESRSPKAQAGRVYPLHGPVEYSHAEVAEILSRVLGKPVEYKQVSVEQMLQTLIESASGPPPEQNTATTLYGGGPYIIQHLTEVAVDHEHGIFSGTNDVVQTITGAPPLELEAFLVKHRAAFE